MGVPIATADDFAREIINEWADSFEEDFSLREEIAELAGRHAVAFFYFDGNRWHCYSELKEHLPTAMWETPPVPNWPASWGVLLVGTVFRDVLKRRDDLAEGEEETEA